MSASQGCKGAVNMSTMALIVSIEAVVWVMPVKLYRP